jgi:SAM-dependent methyltransferase
MAGPARRRGLAWTRLWGLEAQPSPRYRSRRSRWPDWWRGAHPPVPPQLAGCNQVVSPRRLELEVARRCYTVGMVDDPRHPDPLRHRARSFGTNAELYDRTRPTYPATLVADLLAGAPRSILDVGTGTGRAARLLQGEGRHVVGIEPDERMAAVAVGHGVEVEIGTFEKWDARGRRFDLLVSGQAWHWVDPVVGAARAAEVLRPGGRFAAFWNVMHHVPAVRAVFDDVYNRHAPDLLTSSVALGVDTTIDGRADVAAAGLSGAAFRDVTERRVTYEWRADYTPSDWIGLLRTHSDHEILAPATREALLDDLEAALTAIGPSFPIDFRTELLAATRI